MYKYIKKQQITDGYQIVSTICGLNVQTNFIGYIKEFFLQQRFSLIFVWFTFLSTLNLLYKIILSILKLKPKNKCRYLIFDYQTKSSDKWR